MSWLLAAPILIPFATAIVVFLAPMRWLGVAGVLALLAASISLVVEVASRGVIATQIAGWPAPFGITLVADHLSAFMVVITAILGLAAAIYALPELERPQRAGGFDPLFQILLGGMCGAFLAGDLFNLYVWFEVMLIASFALLVLGGRARQLDAAVKYATLNLFSTALMLAGVGLLYGLTGTLNMADLHLQVREIDNPGLLSAIAGLFLVALGVKAAVFPLFFWVPATYHTPPVAISAMFAGLVTKVGVYALLRVFTVIFTHDVGYTHSVLLGVAALTMVTGVLGAVSQNEFRRILSFHSISQIGYMVLGLGLWTPLALGGAIFFMAHHSVVKANLFLVSGAVARLAGSYQLKELGGLYRARPLLAFLFLVSAFALGGMPPLTGFWGKLVLVKATLEVGHYLLAAIALAVGLLTLLSMAKIWTEAFWKPRPDGAGVLPPAPGWSESVLLLAPIGALAGLILASGLWFEPILAFVVSAGEQLMDPTAYVRAVLEVGR